MDYCYEKPKIAVVLTVFASEKIRHRRKNVEKQLKTGIILYVFLKGWDYARVNNGGSGRYCSGIGRFVSRRYY